MFQSSPAGEGRCCLVAGSYAVAFVVFQSSPAGEGRCCVGLVGTVGGNVTVSILTGR